MRHFLAVSTLSLSLFAIYTLSQPSAAEVALESNEALMTIIEESLSGSELYSAARHTPFRLTGSVVRGEKSTEEGRAVYRCEVSLILMERRTGAVRALLTGRAAGSGPSVGELEEKVLRSAVKSALRRLETIELPRT